MAMSGDIRFRKLPPAWFIKLLNSFRYRLHYLSRRMFPGNIVLYEHFQYLWLLPCIKVAAELNIAGLVKDKPRTISELAELTGCDPDYLFRMMRALTGNGIFKLRKDGHYVNTPMSKALIEGKGSIRHVILQHLGHFNWNTLSQLHHAIRTGQDAVTKIHGKNIYDFLLEHPHESEIFSRSMSNLTELAIEPILNAYDFSGCETIADIGGGEGLLLAAVIASDPHLKGILFDRRESMKQAGSILSKFNVTDKITIIQGDFFESAPSGPEIFILKNVLHNWSDEDSIRILSNIKNVLPAKGKILIIEMVIEENNKPSFGKLIDIQMMVFMKNGKERTRKEYEAIVEKTGLKIIRIIPTIAPVSIIEAANPEFK